MSEPVHVFSNGSEYDFWEARNCSRCVKEGRCDLNEALFLDGLNPGMYQGQVLPETARRLGITGDEPGTAAWICKEREAPPPNLIAEEALAKVPAAHHVRAAGTPGLFDQTGGA